MGGQTREGTAEAKRRRAHSRETCDGLIFAIMVVQMLRGYFPHIVHEVFGIAFGALVVWHVVLHREWFAALVHGPWHKHRVCDVGLALGTLACLVVMVASGLVMSDSTGHLFGFGLTAPARAIHLFVVHLGFVLMALHTGWAVRISHATLQKPRDVSGCFRVAGILLMLVLCAAGIWAFVDLGYARYLTFSVGFALTNTAVPLGLAWFEVILAAVPFWCIGFLLEKALHRTSA